MADTQQDIHATAVATGVGSASGYGVMLISGSGEATGSDGAAGDLTLLTDETIPHAQHSASRAISATHTATRSISRAHAATRAISARHERVCEARRAG